MMTGMLSCCLIVVTLNFIDKYPLVFYFIITSAETENGGVIYMMRTSRLNCTKVCILSGGGKVFTPLNFVPESSNGLN